MKVEFTCPYCNIFISTSLRMILFGVRCGMCDKMVRLSKIQEQVDIHTLFSLWMCNNARIAIDGSDKLSKLARSGQTCVSYGYTIKYAISNMRFINNALSQIEGKDVGKIDLSTLFNPEYNDRGYKSQ